MIPSILPLNLSKTCKEDLTSVGIDFHGEANIQLNIIKMSHTIALLEETSADFDDGLSGQFTGE